MTSAETDGARQGLLEKLGLHSAPTGEIILEDVKVPKEALLGQMGDGVKQIFGSLNQTRLSCAASPDA